VNELSIGLLPNNCDAETVKVEISTSQRLLHNQGFLGYRYFVYPNGNHSSIAEDVSSELDIKLAFLFDDRMAMDLSNPLRSSRLSVDSDTPLSKFKFIISG